MATAEFSTEISPLSSSSRISQLTTYFQDPAFITLMVCMCIMVVIIGILSAMVCRLKRRPRIKKRIIVSKNVTPLTDRPSHSEKCEITIENCCNMNVCETVSSISVYCELGTSCFFFNLAMFRNAKPQKFSQ